MYETGKFVAPTPRLTRSLCRRRHPPLRRLPHRRPVPAPPDTSPAPSTPPSSALTAPTTSTCCVTPTATTCSPRTRWYASSATRETTAFRGTCRLCHTTIRAHNSVNNSLRTATATIYNSAGLTGRARLVPKKEQWTTQPSSSSSGRQVCSHRWRQHLRHQVRQLPQCQRQEDLRRHPRQRRQCQLHNLQRRQSRSTGAVTTVSRKPYRFMPGLGNFRYNGGDNADQWTVKTRQPGQQAGLLHPERRQHQ